MNDVEKTLEEIAARAAAREADPEWQEKQRKEQAEREQSAKRALAVAQRKALAKLGLPDKDVELLRGAMVQKTAAVVVLEEAAVLTVLSGGTGTGKTTAASLWLFDWIYDPANWAPRGDDYVDQIGAVVFVTAARLARWGRYDDDAMDTILRANRVVIDDLGAEFLDQKGAYLSLLDEIINERYARRRQTVLTTNLPVETFRERYGERITDRIRESGRFAALGNESMRGRGRALPLAQPAKERVTGDDDDDSDEDPVYDGWRTSRRIPCVWPKATG